MDDCDHNSVCVNTVGDYNCTCNFGFSKELYGNTCSKTNLVNNVLTTNLRITELNYYNYLFSMT